jgi:hypothetical protein
LRKVEREVGIRAAQNLGETIAHHLLDIGQGTSEALPAGIIARRPPKRFLQERARTSPEWRGRQQRKQRLVLCAGYLESTGLRGPNHAGSEQIDFNALRLHPNIPGG